MKKMFIGLILGVSLLGLSTNVYAGNTRDTSLPQKWISYPVKNAVTTEYRDKLDYTSHYVNNFTSLHLYIKSKSSGKNLTVNGHAVVRNGEWFVRNLIKERGYNRCYLHITTERKKEEGYLDGLWSPDSVGNYPNAN